MLRKIGFMLLATFPLASTATLAESGVVRGTTSDGRSFICDPECKMSSRILTVPDAVNANKPDWKPEIPTTEDERVFHLLTLAYNGVVSHGPSMTMQQCMDAIALLAPIQLQDEIKVTGTGFRVQSNITTFLPWNIVQADCD